jgi:hypothetical protein
MNIHLTVLYRQITMYNTICVNEILNRTMIVQTTRQLQSFL